ncbi:type I-C CRISPR-associated protein Cas7/Csd2 [Streptococcus equi subsp. zooepidemicus]|uniref:type I-C CRISPR-associated protein Cas7/Csd2 n=1 Tax=Streptococcus equi TaxID=1336 RepID=UPI0024A9458B|nr:type I-C CRISPR-associated protein Cas7/Csd2 [Streptococcus equi]MDI5917574.1 type I-C CRISPR-associated protein Cas7/Csd2 [Streptococcus equi subsp. zooepidemicus]MDI5955433.1 type I-C CRISPR-associated protein Cas7/Csd2 [Streptococcus equi subsp. zooepidemicus]
MLEHKIDFMVTVEVREANANGDPLSGNMPRTNAKGYGLMSDVSIKRKIRNRMQDMGHRIFVQSRDRVDDNLYSLKARLENKGYFEKVKKDFSVENFLDKINKEWLDVRSFGQVFAFKGYSAANVRGPVSISWAKSLETIVSQSVQITKSTNSELDSKNELESSTMGTKHFVDYGIYVIKGSINAHFAEKTGFSEEDADIIKQALVSLFENDASSARPEGSMRVREVFWFTHSSKLGNVSSARVFDLLVFDMETPDKDRYEAYGIHLDEEKLAAYQAKGLMVEVLEGL